MMGWGCVAHSHLLMLGPAITLFLHVWSHPTHENPFGHTAVKRLRPDISVRRIPFVCLIPA